MDKKLKELLAYGYGPASEFDPTYYFSNPSSGLVDFAIHHTNDIVHRWYNQPCYMNLAVGASLTEVEAGSRYNHSTHRYEHLPGTSLGKSDYVWIALRLPSTSKYGMDYEDDLNRDEIAGDHDYDDDTDDPLYGDEDTPVKTSADDELAVKWWKYVFSQKYSPWRKAIIAPVEYLKNDKDQIIGAKLMMDNTIHSQNFVSMCIASRLPWENLGHLRIWGHMRDAGFKRYESMYIAAHLRYLRNGKDIGFRTCSGHFTFAPWETNINIKWLRDGTPKCSNQMLTVDHYYRVEYIWNDTHSRVVNKITDILLYPILRNSGIQYSGSFKSAFDRSEECDGLTSVLGTWDVVLPKLKENYDKWKA